MPTISNEAPIQGSYIADKRDQIKGALLLGNVDNTRDADKPVSAATQLALNQKMDTADAVGSVVSNEAATAGVIKITNLVAVSASDYAAMEAAVPSQVDPNTTYLILENI